MAEREQKTEPGIASILGQAEACYVGFAVDETIRKDAASGGVVNAITRYLLDTGRVDGVVASELNIVDGSLAPKTIIARRSEDLGRCKNSIYLDFNIGGSGIFKSLLESLEQTGERFCVVGLYCHLSNLAIAMQRRGIARDRVIMIGLFCSHAPYPVLLKKVLERQGADLARAGAYHTKAGDGFRDGRWFGRSRLDYADGSSLEFPFIEFTAFKNAWFYTPRKCLSCPDQFSEIADISCGDAWYPEIRRHRFKQTTVIARTSASKALMHDMVRDGALELRTLDPAAIINSQRRVAGVEKASLAARVKMAGWFGIKLPEQTGSIRIRDWAHSALMLAAVQVSKNERAMNLIMRLPTPVVLGFTLFIKVLEQSLLPKLPVNRAIGPIVTGWEQTEDQQNP